MYLCGCKQAEVNQHSSAYTMINKPPALLKSIYTVLQDYNNVAEARSYGVFTFPCVCLVY